MAVAALETAHPTMVSQDYIAGAGETYFVLRSSRSPLLKTKYVPPALARITPLSELKAPRTDMVKR